jgi:glycosyltransferase involved in cell wall biosynthesis
MPQLSIGMPVYNGEQYLADTLDSLLAQSFEQFEIVISDNASTDRTAAICRYYQQKDPRIRYVRNHKNLGAAANFNRAFELSSAPLFHGGACDDLYEPQFLERCVEVLDHRPDVVLCHTCARVVGDHGEPLLYNEEQNCFVDTYGGLVMGPEVRDLGGAAQPEARFRQILWQSSWCWPVSGVIRRDALLKTRLLESYYGADKVLLAKLAVMGRFHQIDEKLFVKRVHRGCTYYKSACERVKHEANADSTAPLGIPQVKMLHNYIKMVFAADLSAWQRLHCMFTLVGLTRRRGLWRRLLIPGPDNYLGLSFGGR